MKRSLLLLPLAAAVAVAVASSCSSGPSTPNLGPGTFAVAVTAVNGGALPTLQNPMRPTPTTTNDAWTFTIEAHSPTGELDTSFNGYVRLTLTPGTVVLVSGTGAQDRNILLAGGKASGVVQVTNVYGPTNLWVEDLGYVPLPASAPPGTKPQCANGKDDNHNGIIDFPADPGCYYADDNEENGGTYAAGVSPPVQYRLPTIIDVRGRMTIPSVDGGTGYQTGGASTPYQNEAIQIATGDPTIGNPQDPANGNRPWLVVTALTTNGFYVTDLNPSAVDAGYNSLFAYNFSAPPGMAVCDRITSLAGTADDFYGFTQLSFPSFTNSYTIPDGGVFDDPCHVPEPADLPPSLFTGNKGGTAPNLFPYESALVRLSGYTIAEHFGPGLMTGASAPGVSNCDFNGNGQIDFTTAEGTCATACDNDVQCSEWTAFSARNEYKVRFGTAAGLCSSAGRACILVDTSVLDTFDPVANAGKTLPYVTGNLAEFSGGSLNWTVIARCGDDVACSTTWGCTTETPKPSTAACLAVHTLSDNDEGTN